MDTGISETAARLKSSKHSIRGVQIIGDDLSCLQDGAKIKVPGTVLNVVGALLQLLGEREGSSDFAVFSTWLSPLVSKKVTQGATYGTIESHIRDACQGQNEMLLAKARWLFPLYGDKPPHWVLGWVDLSARELHIFDSAPELQSYMWAEPALVELAETVFTMLGQPKMDVAPWPVLKHSPPELQRQMNGYACGFFVIHAMRAIGNGESITTVTNDQTTKIRSETLDLIHHNLSLLCAPPPEDVLMASPAEDVVMASIVQLHATSSARADIPVVPVVLKEIVSESDTHSNQAQAQAAEKNMVAASSRLEPDIDLKLFAKGPVEAIASKRELDADTDTESSLPAKKPRARKSTPEERQALLDTNENTSTVEAHRVLCAACSTWVKLHISQKFKLDNWTQHETKCPKITGKRRVRSVIQMASTAPLPKEAASMSAFLGLSRSAPSTVNARTSDSDSESESSKKKPVYSSKMVNATPSITNFFSRGPIKNPPPKPVAIIPPKSCVGLSGNKYTEYIERTETRSLGGVSTTLRARLVRQIFLYKQFQPLKNEARTAELIQRVEMSVPTRGNDCLASPDWTESEQRKFDDALKGFARWEVEFGNKTVRSARCEGLVNKPGGICDACMKVASDESLIHAINRKNREADLPLEEQREIQLNRSKYSSKRFHDVEARRLDALLKDPIAFKALKTLEKGETTECFLQLYEATLNGKLKGFETVKELCVVVADVIKRQDANTMSGIRYPPHYLNFAILMRSHGGNSSKQFGILSGQIPLPSARHIRALVANSEDALQNPYLIYENMARVKRLVDSIHYSGPIAVAGDCTKVRKRLTYSNDFGGHILGSVWQLEDCIAEDPDDIERVIDEITKAKAEATQVRAILIKVPLPHIPPQVVALLPTNGKDDAAKIVEQHLKLIAMAAELSLSVVSFAADGAASELSAQKQMDDQQTPYPPITYDYPMYGIHLRAPVMKTGPVVSVQDAGHAKKTARNGPQSGTKTESLGRDVVVNQTFVDLQETGESGLLASDVKNVDKQDDGPARHLFHVKALRACTTEEGVLFDAWLNRTMTVQNRVLAVLRARFFLHFWRAHIVHMSTKYPDLYSTARSFITAPSFHIFNRLCDTLLLLIIIYARRYPDQPFCPWLLGTEFVEHFFGLARMLLPNFTYAEFLKMVQHIMVRQRILLSGSFKEKRQRNSRVGYVLDFDASPLTAEDRKLAEVKITDVEMHSLVELAFVEAALICTQLLHIPAPKPTVQKPLKLTPLGAPTPKTNPSAGDNIDSDSSSDDEEDEQDEPDISEPFSGHTRSEESRAIALAAHDAARYSALCDDYEAVVKELNAQPAAAVSGPLPPPVISTPTAPTAPPRSEIIDESGKLSISMMLRARLHWQAGTTTRSEKVSEIDSKYALSRIARAIESPGDDTEPEKMTHQEASNLTRVLQEQNTTIQENRPQKTRELRWKNVAAAVQRLVDADVVPHIMAKNVHQLNPLAIGSMTVMWNGTRFYIGEIMDVYKRGANSRYGSVPNAQSVSGLAFLSLRVYLPLLTAAEDSDSEQDEVGPGAAPIAVPLFSCHHKGLQIRLHTHAKIDDLLFNLGRGAFEKSVPGEQHRTLKRTAALCWTSLTGPGEVSKEIKKLTLKIEGSVALVAKRRFLRKPPSLVAYLLGGVGLGLLSRPGRWQVAGALLCTAGLALFAAVQHSIVQGLTLFCEETLKADMRDISESYRSPAAFFVAARPREAAEPGSSGEEPEEVVGYVGFEYLPEKDASKAEVRRMIVSERHRRRGIAERLMRALIAHAETIPGLQSIELGTSEFQPGARRLYERLGWEIFRAEEMGHKFLTLTVRHFRRPVGKRVP
ncbi:hypothetical protein B0H11DRAFT_2268643 [Mycena galericulata]|nr:hypothetical protein B0H11DRAFT_2268643 [Mycena galericulata]